MQLTSNISFTQAFHVYTFIKFVEIDRKHWVVYHTVDVAYKKVYYTRIFLKTQNKKNLYIPLLIESYVVNSMTFCTNEVKLKSAESRS